MNIWDKSRSRVCWIGLVVTLLTAAAALVARAYALEQTEAVLFTPLTADASWEGSWELSERGADPSQAGSLTGTDRVNFSFTGVHLALRVRRADYRANLWVSVDGEPANRLPQTERGAYLVLSSPDYRPQVVTIPVAGGLDDGPHSAQIIADRGWDQWPLVGWRVSRGPDTALYDQALRGLSAVAIVCFFGAIGWRGDDGRPRRPGWRGGDKAWDGPGDQPQRGIMLDPGPGSCRDAEAGALCRLPAAIGDLPALFSRLSSPISIALVAGTFYVSPWTSLTVVSGAVLAILMILRLDLGLALVALSAPFYLHPRPLLDRSFSMAEITTLLCLLSWAVRLVMVRSTMTESVDARIERGTTFLPSPVAIRRSLRTVLQSLSTLDLAVLFLVVVAAVSALFADYRHVALRELRVVIVESALFYGMLRTTRLGPKAVWRIVDALVMGAVAVALIGLAQYALDVNVITAEQGFRRLRSVYGSPNNAALYLGRVLPLQLAGAFLAARRQRRVLYGGLAVPVALALLFTFSRAALLLGLPFSLLVLGVLVGTTHGANSFVRRFATLVRRWRWIALGLVAVGVLGIIALLNTPRFAGLLDPGTGTLFFRVQLWRASWNMFRDHPWLGIGPDNFLYHYRGRYILPAAWQEPHLSHAHNLLLSYATRLGIVGLFAGVGLHISFWRLVLPLRHRVDPEQRALALGLMGSMAYTLAHGLVDASFFFVDLAFAFLLTLGLVQWLSGSAIYEQED